jgi:hypothetical protein
VQHEKGLHQPVFNIQYLNERKENVYVRYEAVGVKFKCDSRYKRQYQQNQMYHPERPVFAFAADKYDGDGHFTPQYWAQAALQNIMLRGAGLGAVLVNIAVLLAFGLAGIAVALLRYKRFIRSAGG